MNNYEQRKYMLVIKRDNKDYLPLEWNKTKYYKGENLYNLKDIDKFTSSISDLDLVEDIIDRNLVSTEEKFKTFAIIFNEKGKTRELKEGVVFEDTADVLNPDNIIAFISVNINNKEFINNISTLIKGEDKASQEFKYILKNIDIFKEKGANAIKIALNKLKKMPYEDIRSLSLQINNRYINR